MKPPIPKHDPLRPKADEDVAGIMPGDDADDDTELAETAEPAAEVALDIEWGTLTAGTGRARPASRSYKSW
ncbi:hypothetical protein HK436_13440 [Mesorhizobium sediminum]|nr:hypothetical protein [Mesorhizobium sediminum]